MPGRWRFRTLPCAVVLLRRSHALAENAGLEEAAPALREGSCFPSAGSDGGGSSAKPCAGGWLGWQDLLDHAGEMKKVHLRTLLQNRSRRDAMFVRSGDGIVLDFSRQKLTTASLDRLLALAEGMGVERKRQRMFRGDKVNEVEARAALHVALRAPRGAAIVVDGRDVVQDVWAVLDSVRAFADSVRSGRWRGCTGRELTDVVCIGIGGSYLGVEFVFEALRTDPAAARMAAGRRLRFLANVDPVGVKRALDGLAAETTLVVVISKTFTTAETMLNARTVRAWLVAELGSSDCLAKHVVAVSTAVDKAREFGVDPANVFDFWDWVGGRFSVCSAVGVLPLSLQFGFGTVERFLQGAHAMDEHFRTAGLRANLPVLLALLAVWNTSCLGHEGYAILPYCEALVGLAPHIQQLEMESNGKRVQTDGTEVSVGTSAIYFGEPGTKGQHSFYQLMHQGRTVPAEFIGFKVSQNPLELEGEPVTNHDELMSNFFAQPDALAIGKTAEELRLAGTPEHLIPHLTFPGDRPSLSMLLPRCDAYWLGQLLALYEHRSAVQGWLWNINSFDQYGVELGKRFAKDVRSFIQAARTGAPEDRSLDGTADRLLLEYLA